MDDDELDDLVLQGHGGAIADPENYVDDPNEKKKEKLNERLKCEMVKIAEEASRQYSVRISPQFAQCLTELTSTYVHTLANDLAAFAQHRKGKVITHDDVLLAVRKMPAVVDQVNAVLPENLVAKKSRQTKLTTMQ